jgi:hypothetical protein
MIVAAIGPGWSGEQQRHTTCTAAAGVRRTDTLSGHWGLDRLGTIQVFLVPDWFSLYCPRSHYFPRRTNAGVCLP